jgi:hypothetical protein
MFGVVVFFLAREGFSLPYRDPEPEMDALKSLHILQVRLPVVDLWNDESIVRRGLS